VVISLLAASTARVSEIIAGNVVATLIPTVHFHLLVLDGVYRRDGERRQRFVPVPAPSTEELKGLVQRMAERLARALGAHYAGYRQCVSHLRSEPRTTEGRSVALTAFATRSSAPATVPRRAGLGL
jgi:hypothetical protein